VGVSVARRAEASVRAAVGEDPAQREDVAAHLYLLHPAELRGGAKQPLSRADLEDKFRQNCAHGGWPEKRAAEFLAFSRGAFSATIDLSAFRG